MVDAERVPLEVPLNVADGVPGGVIVLERDSDGVGRVMDGEAEGDALSVAVPVLVVEGVIDSVLDWERLSDGDNVSVELLVGCVHENDDVDVGAGVMVSDCVGDKLVVLENVDDAVGGGVMVAVCVPEDVAVSDCE